MSDTHKSGVLKIIHISHRGNLKSNEWDSNPIRVSQVLDSGYHCEIDLWSINKSFYLGHDGPKFEINYDWLESRASKLLIHCKNFASLSEIERRSKSEYNSLHYFWHQQDNYTLTNKGIVICYPGVQAVDRGIQMIAEQWGEVNKNGYGICSDYIETFKGIKEW